jgi:hypothetical protein
VFAFLARPVSQEKNKKGYKQKRSQTILDGRYNENPKYTIGQFLYLICTFSKLKDKKINIQEK